MSRASFIAVVALAICFQDSTPQARDSCLPPDVSKRSGGIQKTLVLDGSPVHSAGNIRVHASNWGAIGSMPGAGLPFSGAPSTEWPAGSGVNYLFVAGLWVGALVHGEARVSTSAYQFEFRPSSDSREVVYYTRHGMPHADRIPADPDDDHDGAVNEDPQDGFDNDHDGAVDEDFAGISYQMMSRHFRDDQAGTNEIYPDHRPMNLDVREESYSFAEPDYDDFVGFTFTITNTGVDTLQSVFIGMMADGDVGNLTRGNYWEDDAAAVTSVLVDLGAHGVASYTFPYWRDADGDGGEAPGRCGFVLLDHTTDPTGATAPSAVSLHSWATFRGSASYEEGGDPTNDFERYAVMASNRIAPPLDMGDVRAVMSVGPFPTMLPGQTLTFTVALVVTPDDYSNVARAIEAYQGRWFDLDHNPATGIDGREHQEHWYLPGDQFESAWVSRFEVGPDGGAVRLRWSLENAGLAQNIEVKRAPAAGGTPVTLATLPGNKREFLDASLARGGKYTYSIVVNGDFDSEVSSPWIAVDVPDLPTTLWLSSPNPFRDATTISAHLPTQSNLNLAVFDVAGRRVAKLASGMRGAGEHIFTWNGTDETGRRVPAGVYFCRLDVGGQVFHEKLVVVH